MYVLYPCWGANGILAVESFDTVRAGFALKLRRVPIRHGNEWTRDDFDTLSETGPNYAPPLEFVLKDSGRHCYLFPGISTMLGNNILICSLSFPFHSIYRRSMSRQRNIFGTVSHGGTLFFITNHSWLRQRS